MSAKRWIAVGLFIALLFVYVGTEIVMSSDIMDESSADMLSSFSFNKNWQSTVYKPGIGGNIAVIRIEGTMIDQDTGSYASTSGYSQSSVVDMIKTAFERSDVKAVVLYINSPGGGTYEADEIFNLLMDMKKQYNKPLIVYMGSMATSAAYYISVPADQIFANRNTLTGSIGVILSTYTLSGLADKVGIKDQTFKSGEFKDILNPMRDPTDAEKQIIQNMVMESYYFFVQAVMEGRGMTKEEVLPLADGRFYTASQARDLGLIDQIGTLQDAIDEAAKDAEITNPNVLMFEPSPMNAFSSLFSSLNPIQKWLDADPGLATFSRDDYPRMLYMPAW